MARKPTEIIEHVLDRTDRNKVKRKDFEARLKSLRAHDLYPKARAVGRSKAGIVTDDHLANVVLAFVASPNAVDVGEYVDVLRRQKLHAVGGGVQQKSGKTIVASHKAEAGAETIGEFLAHEIRRIRRGKAAFVNSLDAYGAQTAVVLLNPFQEDSEGRFEGNVLIFGNKSSDAGGPGPVVSVRVNADLLQVMADFLGPIE